MLSKTNVLDYMSAQNNVKRFLQTALADNVSYGWKSTHFGVNVNRLFIRQVEENLNALSNVQQVLRNRVNAAAIPSNGFNIKSLECISLDAAFDLPPLRPPTPGAIPHAEPPNVYAVWNSSGNNNNATYTPLV